jgi:hypothetical protein
VRLRVGGPDAVERHFRQEYGEVADASGGDVAVEVRFGPLACATPGRAVIVGGHKTARWRVALSAPDVRPLAATIELRGRPLSFATSLVQGYFVEPLVSIASARVGEVLLPSAALAGTDGALLLIGRSRSGKSSLAARAIASGWTVIGDDQVFLDARGYCRSFPRRMRFYWDLPQVAPRAYARLPRRMRVELGWRRAMRVVTRGYVRPSLPVSPRAFGQRHPSRPARVERVLVLERSDAVDAVTVIGADLAEVVATAGRLLEQQRERVAAGGDDGWRRAIYAAQRAEADVLRRALLHTGPLDRVLIPGRWDARRAVAELALALGIEPDPASSSQPRPDVSTA